MSYPPHAQHEPHDRLVAPADNADITPTAELPTAIHVPASSELPGGIEEPVLAVPSKPDDGYFTTHPATGELDRHPVISTATPDPAALGAVNSAPLAAENIETSDAANLHPTRPVPHSAHSALSIQSTDSTATITAAPAAPVLSAPPQLRPDFPNQAYSALQSQKYPAPRIPTLLRQRSAHPGQIYTFASALASQQLARGAGSSAPVTPGHGLFDLRTQLPSSDWEASDAQGTYASPFLHFTQRVPIKETHVADVDVDPISGRKLINHYEIIDELGRGTHGKVKLGRDLSSENTYVAIKIVERFSKRRKLGRLGTTEDKVKKEVAILKQVRHPNVTALLEVIDDPSRKKVYIVLEWVERGQIQWRAKGIKEITTIEARRYEREKSGKIDPRLEAEDLAIVTEVHRRLARQKRRQVRTFRRVRRDAPEAWSMELVGDDESEISDDDVLSRVSSESFSSRLLQGEGRRSSRTASPLPPLTDEDPNSSDATDQYMSVMNQSETQSPIALANPLTGLEGTMYGAYFSSASGSSEHTRVSSTQSIAARQRAKTSSDSLAHMAAEVLDSDIDDELGYVPVMTNQQIRVAFRDTLLGLQYLHYQGIIHRDIKPPNLLSTKEHRVKISDFGVSYLGRPMAEGDAGEGVSEHEAQDLDDGAKELAKTVGTPAFYAPELCITESIEDAPPITKAIDVWALGVTLFCMLFARTPFVDNEFVVMRQIADEEIYIPRQRLKPIENKSRSRPTSQGSAYPPVASSRRHPLDLAYEDISDELYDLLKRMLVKDPRKRITLEEVRHHAWVVADIQDKVQWLEETDLSRQSQGKKIEVSTEDVKTAVVPLQFLDRVRSGIKKVGERLGIGSRPPTRGRGRSLAGGEYDASPSPAGSPSPQASQDDVRSIVSDAESNARPTKQAEHPLSHSVNVSPGLEKQGHQHGRTMSRPTSALGLDHPSRMMTPLRLTEAVNASMATSGSMRTVKQADFPHARGEESPPRSPIVSQTPTSAESPTSSGSGWAQRLFKTVREHSAVRSSTSRASSSDRGSVPPLDMHGEPSVAVAQASASAHLNSPTGLDERVTATGARDSPTASRPLSAMTSPSSDRLYPHASEGSLSRTSSTGSASSLGRRAMYNVNRTRSPFGSQTKIAAGSTAEDWQRAEDEHIRKLIREGEEERETSSPFEDHDYDRTCPPSPDDQRTKREPSRSRRISSLNIDDPYSSQETSPTGHGSHLAAAVASSTSDFGSAMSLSTSDPSMPSAISETSSMHSVDAVPADEFRKRDLMSSDDTVSPPSAQQEEPFHHGQSERAVHSEDEDEYDDSSDSDGGLVMSRRRSAAKSTPTKASELSTQSMSTGAIHIPERRKESRSGSSNTMKKVISEEGDDQGGLIANPSN